MEPIGFVIVFVLIGLVIRLFAGGMDHSRIRDYVAERGGEVIDVSWAPFGRGWFGDRSDRVYRVRYRDAQGNEREAFCKTSAMSAVYLSDDRIVEEGASRDPRKDTNSQIARLEEENRRLRELVARQEREKSGDA